MAPVPEHVADEVSLYVTVPVGLKVVFGTKLALSVTVWPALTGPVGVRMVVSLGVILLTVKDSHVGLLDPV